MRVVHSDKLVDYHVHVVLVEGNGGETDHLAARIENKRVGDVGWHPDHVSGLDFGLGNGTHGGNVPVDILRRQRPTTLEDDERLHPPPVVVVAQGNGLVDFERLDREVALQGVELRDGATLIAVNRHEAPDESWHSFPPVLFASDNSNSFLYLSSPSR